MCDERVLMNIDLSLNRVYWEYVGAYLRRPENTLSGDRFLTELVYRSTV